MGCHSTGRLGLQSIAWDALAFLAHDLTRLAVLTDNMLVSGDAAFSA